MNPRKKESESSSKAPNLREMILDKIVSEEISGKREFSVMTRLSRQFIDIIDALVKLDIFKSRSEAVSALVMKTILSELDLFEELKEQAEKLDALQSTVETLALRALRE
jgi:Arc/MetJ-type ribon-helix-helix transcriptional regulator